MKMTSMLLAVTLSVAALSARANIEPPDQLIRETASDVIATVKADKELRAGNQKKMLALVEAKILPHFDFEKMTRLAVGRPWRMATAEQRQALVTEFRTLLVRTYTAAFAHYENQKVDVKAPRMNGDDANQAMVDTTISKPGSPAIAVNYVMEKKPDGWKVFDLTIEGASLIASYRGTFREQVQAGGIDGLIKFLSDKNKANVGKPLGKKAASK